MFSVLMRRDHICDNTGVVTLIEENIDVEVFEDLKLPLFVSTAELVSGAHRVFHTGQLRKVLLASAALPGIFPPVEVDGVLMIDGGVVSNIPTSAAVRARPERMFILDVSRPVSNKISHSPLGMMIQAINITRNLCAQRDLEAAQVLSGAVVLPRPENEPAMSFDDTSHTEELIRLGYERTQRFLAEELQEVA
jgi:NTE family protein